MGDCLSSGSDDDRNVSPACVAGTSDTREPDDGFYTSVVQKILPALVQVLGSEKVKEVPAYLDSDSSDVDMVSVPLDRSHVPVSGVSSPVGLPATQAAPQVIVAASHSSAGDFLGFPVVTDQHLPVVQSREANGPPVSKTFCPEYQALFYAWYLMTRKPGC